MTAGICSICSHEPIFKVTAEIVSILSLCGGWWVGGFERSFVKIKSFTKIKIGSNKLGQNQVSNDIADL